MLEMADGACRAFLGSHRVGVMALARDGRAYAVPLFYAYDGTSVYLHSRHGEKDGFVDGTAEGCFVVVDVQGDDDWASVQARGRVSRVETNAEAEHAFRAIAQNPFPPEFGVDLRGVPNRTGKGAFLWVMRVEHLSGRQSRSPVRMA